MLPAAARLRQRAEFTATVRSGRRGISPSVVVHRRSVSKEASGSARVGFVVARPVGNAVTRNLVRRRLRHLVRARLASLPCGADLVVRATPGAAGLDSAALAVDLDRALAAAGRSGEPR